MEFLINLENIFIIHISIWCFILIVIRKKNCDISNNKTYEL